MILLSLSPIYGEMTPNPSAGVAIVSVSSQSNEEELVSGIIEPHIHGKLTLSSENKWKWVNGRQILKEIAQRNSNLFPDIGLYGLLLFVTITIGIMVYYYRTTLLAKLDTLLYPEPVPKETALQALQKLKQKQNIGEIGGVLRKYLSEIHHISLASKTSSETLNFIKKMQYSQETQEMLTELFLYTDLANFAHFHPGDQKQKDIFQKVSRFIERVT